MSALRTLVDYGVAAVWKVLWLLGLVTQEETRRYEEEHRVETTKIEEHEAEARFEEEEHREETTEIEEIYQESDDGVTWRTIRKVTTITPEGTTERTEVLKEERMVRDEAGLAEAAAARLPGGEEEGTSVDQQGV